MDSIPAGGWTLCTDCLEVFNEEAFWVDNSAAPDHGEGDERPVCTVCYQENHEKSWKELTSNG